MRKCSYTAIPTPLRLAYESKGFSMALENSRKEGSSREKVC
jgi:hypothetical protein